jgi:adenosylcobyric acid synthase
LLDLSTVLTQRKQLENVAGRLTIGDAGAPVRGYEIHMGRTHGPALARPLVALDSGNFDGAVSDDNQIAATYLHGVFDTPEACAALLAWAGVEGAEPLDYPALREASLDRLADSFAESLDLEALRAAFAQ